MQNALTKSNTRGAVASLKIVVFQVGTLNLALPAKNVYRVLKQTPVYNGGFNSVVIAHIGARGIAVVDLHRRLFQSSITSQVSQERYLVVAENKEGELYGMPTIAVPALKVVPVSSVQVLPDSYRHTNILGMANHYCHVSEAEQSVTIFLLDIDQLLANG